MRNRRAGWTVIEMFIALTFVIMVFGLIWKSMSFLRDAIGQDASLPLLIEANAFYLDVGKNIRSSRGIVNVFDDRLELDVYPYGQYPPLDRRIVENPERLVYRYDAPSNSIIRELYSSTDTATAGLINQQTFFRKMPLLPPSTDHRYFVDNYGSVGAHKSVEVTIPFVRPFTKQPWAPWAIEETARGKGI